MKPQKFIGWLAAGAAVIAALTLWPLFTYGGNMILQGAVFLLAWTFTLTSLSYAVIYPSLNASGPAFMNRILGITMLRLLLSIFLVFALWFLVPEQVIVLVVVYFFYYVSGLTFEILVLLRNLRRISK